MRPIDAVEAEAGIKMLFPDMPKIDFMDNVSNWRKKNKQYLECLDVIRSLPTADVVERKRGKWIDAKPRSGQIGKVCSVCGNEAYWDSDYGQQLFDWCPYCGSYNGEESDNGNVGKGSGRGTGGR